MIVLDASALVDLLVRRPSWQAVRWHLEREGETAAPDLVYAEVGSALWRLVRAQEITEDDAATGLSGLHRMPLQAYPLRDLLTEAWTHRHSARIADAFYLACARVLDAPLLTTDSRLARGHHGVPVIAC